MKMKVLLWLLLLTSTIIFSGSRGDVNCDGKVDIIDALYIARNCVKIKVPVFDRTVADFNCDNKITIIDALLIARHSVGVINYFPNCKAYSTPTPLGKNIFYSTWDTTKVSKHSYKSIKQSLSVITTEHSSNSNQIKLPLVKNGDYDFVVNWGDGTESHIMSYDDIETIHTYKNPGIYDLKIIGKIEGFAFNYKGDHLKLLQIRSWGPLKLKNNGAYFSGAKNLNILAKDKLDLSGITNFSHMFHGCKMKHIPDIETWDVSAVTDMNHMFCGFDTFNQNIGKWDTSNVINMKFMFMNAKTFNQNIGNWDVSKVTNMGHMFLSAKFFNQDIGNWNVSNVNSMRYMFGSAVTFNQDIGNWDVSQVTDMTGMFTRAKSFNQDIGHWNVSKVTKMSSMFSNTISFNQYIGNWDVSNVTDMGYMFEYAYSFNQHIGNWDVSNVKSMNGLFRYSKKFNQNIGTWNVSEAKYMKEMFKNVTLSIKNYDALLSSWAVLPVLQNGVKFHGGHSKYSANSKEARDLLIQKYHWEITDGGLAKKAFNKS